MTETQALAERTTTGKSKHSNESNSKSNNKSNSKNYTTASRMNTVLLLLLGLLATSHAAVMRERRETDVVELENQTEVDESAPTDLVKDEPVEAEAESEVAVEAEPAAEEDTELAGEEETVTVEAVVEETKEQEEAVEAEQPEKEAEKIEAASENDVLKAVDETVEVVAEAVPEVLPEVDVSNSTVAEEDAIEVADTAAEIMEEEVEEVNATVATTAAPEVVSEAAEVEAAEVEAAEVDAAEVDATEVDAAEVDATEVDAAEVDAAEVDAAEVEVEEAVVANNATEENAVIEENAAESEADVSLEERINELEKENEELKKALDAADTSFKPAPSQRGFWPLKDGYLGDNLVSGGSDIRLSGVNFNSEANQWLSSPARFTGQADSYGEILNSSTIQVSGSFSWMAAVNRKTSGDGALFEWSQDGSVATGIWIVGNRLSIALEFESCPSESVSFAYEVDNNKWYVLAASYDAETRTGSLWVDGVAQQVQVAGADDCSGALRTGSDLRINKRVGDSRRLNADISCVGLFDEALAYTEMYEYTIVQCKN